VVLLALDDHVRGLRGGYGRVVLLLAGHRGHPGPSAGQLL
jgi:hypothetical protein